MRAYRRVAPREGWNTPAGGLLRRTLPTNPAARFSVAPRTRPVTYHDAQTASQARSGLRRRGLSRCAALGALAALIFSISGCVAWRTQVPLLAFDAERAGTKMLRPGARSTACCTRILGMAAACNAPPLDGALRQLLAADVEADALTAATIETRTLALGVFDRTCVTVHADVVRTTSVVRLPVPAGHESHH